MSGKARIAVVFGTRPEAIKMAPVAKAIAAHPQLECRVVVTAQHREMMDQVLEAFGIVPDADLNLMKPGQDLFDVTSRVLLGLREVLSAERPDAVLVHGDTTTCLAATLAAFYLHIPVGHVEAGLRTGNLAAPFPEEANRVLADRLCRWWFAPTAQSAANQTREGLGPDGVHITGNTVIDALLWMRERVVEQPARAMGADFGSYTSFLDADEPGRMVLITGHRRESFGEGFEQICQAIRTLAERHPDVQFVYPVHLNPRVQEPVHRVLSGLSNVHLLAPLDYPSFVRLMDSSTLILTDSGGIQEEAPSLGKPVLVMRDTTERPEGVAAGTVSLVGTDRATIVDRVHRLLTDPEEMLRFQRAHNPYGDGRASVRIAEILASEVAVGDR